MKKIKKERISISIEKQLDNLLNDIINNKSKYIEWLIYQDMLEKSSNVRIKKILI